MDCIDEKGARRWRVEADYSNEGGKRKHKVSVWVLGTHMEELAWRYGVYMDVSKLLQCCPCAGVACPDPDKVLQLLSSCHAHSSGEGELEHGMAQHRTAAGAAASPS